MFLDLSLLRPCAPLLMLLLLLLLLHVAWVFALCAS